MNLTAEEQEELRQVAHEFMQICISVKQIMKRIGIYDEIESLNKRLIGNMIERSDAMDDIRSRLQVLEDKVCDK
jgi:hypothetical protein